MSIEFDFDEVFDDDYLYFYAEILTDERSEAEADIILRLGSIEPGDRTLDLACGHGRIANRLAARGASVTGLDLTSRFLDVARAEASARGLDVEYVQGDVRQLSYTERFDVVVSWFTSFGYFDDATNRRILRAVHRSLRPQGRFLMELNHGPGLWAGYLPSIVQRRGEDLMVDEHRYDALTGRVHNRRTVLRDGERRSFSFFTRLFTYTELRDWLIDAGFSQVDGYGGDGLSLDARSRRMIVRAVQ